MSPSKFRLFLLKKIPIAYIAGIKLEQLSLLNCSTYVKLSWWNQNPFHSMFWAVQGMAAELSTGLLCMQVIKESEKSISMLVVEQKASFLKKATGKITFNCIEGQSIAEAINTAIDTGDGVTITIDSVGIDESGDKVAVFSFKWSFKVRA